MLRNRMRIAAGLLAVLLLTFFFLRYQNNALTVSSYAFVSGKLPAAFGTYTIVHLSDLHNKRFGERQETLAGKIEKLKPDLIVVTGDLIDSKRYDEAPAVELMERLTALADVYYVPGNHEYFSGRYETLEARLSETGVRVLRNDHTTIRAGETELSLLGIDDPAFAEEGGDAYAEARAAAARLAEATSDLDRPDRVTLLLAHRPELLHVYADYPIDLVFAGHAHGGQVRLPFVGGLVAPDQGWLPEYTAGLHREGETTMVVSRGLGNSIVPQRLFNRPEIVVVKLQSAQ